MCGVHGIKIPYKDSFIEDMDIPKWIAIHTPTTKGLKVIENLSLENTHILEVTLSLGTILSRMST